MAAITKTPSNTWKTIIRKRGWPTTIKTFRTRRDAEDWARRTEDEMVRGVYINRADADRLLLKQARKARQRMEAAQAHVGLPTPGPIDEDSPLERRMMDIA